MPMPTRREVAKVLSRLEADVVGIDVVEQPRRKRHVDALADSLDRRTGDVLLELLRLLVHLMTYDCSGGPADDRSDDRSARRRPGLIANDRTDRPTHAGADRRTLLFLIERGAGCQEHDP
jgi:hypothetical protein